MTGLNALRTHRENTHTHLDHPFVVKVNCKKMQLKLLSKIRVLPNSFVLCDAVMGKSGDGRDHLTKKRREKWVQDRGSGHKIPYSPKQKNYGRAKES